MIVLDGFQENALKELVVANAERLQRLKEKHIDLLRRAATAQFSEWLELANELRLSGEYRQQPDVLKVAVAWVLLYSAEHQTQEAVRNVLGLSGGEVSGVVAMQQSEPVTILSFESDGRVVVQSKATGRKRYVQPSSLSPYPPAY